MKRLALLLLLSLQCVAVSAQQDRFDQANDHLEEYRIDRAMEIYSEIKRDGHRSGMLFYNMGLASMYRDSLGLAKYYFLRASEYEDAIEEAERALRHVNNQFDRRSAILPPPPWERLFQYLDGTIGFTVLTVSGLLLLNLTVALLLTGWIRNRSRPSRWLQRSAFLSGLLSIPFLLAAFWLWQSDQRYSTGVMIQNSATLYNEPDTTSAAVTTVYEGFTMRVDRSGRSSDSDVEWHTVRLQNGMTGWIQANRIRTF